MNFKPSPTGRAFLASRAFVKLICGPVGGGKSTLALWALWSIALDQHAHNGVRRTKFLIVRNTMGQLKSTVKPLINQWFVEMPTLQFGAAIGEWRVTDNVFEIKVRLPDNTVVHTEFLLMPADTPEDVRRLLSLEATGAWVEEAREIDPTVFEGLQGRVARFPNQASGGQKYPCVICSTNPPPVNTFWHEKMANPPSNWDVFMQPPAMLEDGSLNPEAENLENLNPDYYPNLVEGKTDDWIGVYLKNKFGAGGLGQPIFRGTFKRDFHTAKAKLVPVPTGMKKVVVGADNGLQGAVVIGQEDARGRVNLLGEAYVPEGMTMGYDRFMDSIVTPKLRELGIPPQHTLFVVDPACFHRSEATEVTIAQVIAKRGYAVQKAGTNIEERRVTAAEWLLMQQIDGEARLRISPACAHLLAALEWGYRYKKHASGQNLAQQDKNHHSHIGNAFEYFTLYFHNGADGTGGKVAAKAVGRSTFAYT